MKDEKAEGLAFCFFYLQAFQKHKSHFNFAIFAAVFDQERRVK